MFSVVPNYYDFLLYDLLSMKGLIVFEIMILLQRGNARAVSKVNVKEREIYLLPCFDVFEKAAPQSTTALKTALLYC